MIASLESTGPLLTDVEEVFMSAKDGTVHGIKRNIAE